jgi:predicted DNA-binding protein
MAMVLRSGTASPNEGALSMPTKTMSLRLDESQARELDAVAMACETTVSEIVREAISERIEKLRQDNSFKERLQRAVDRNKEALDLLA